MRSVYEIGDELLPEGTMVYTLDKKQNRNDLKCDEKYLDIPLVVLVNENSASVQVFLCTPALFFPFIYSFLLQNICPNIPICLLLSFFCQQTENVF